MKQTRIQAVLFDFDGTLTRPGALDFAVIREELNCPADTPVLEFIEALPDDTARSAAYAALDRFELDGAAGSGPNTGAEEILRFIRARGLLTGIVTRNQHACVIRAIENFTGVQVSDFDVIISRDDPAAPKPSPEGILLAARRLGVRPENVLVVGDFLFDIEAGNAAGAVTVFLQNPAAAETAAAESDFTIDTLSALEGIVRLLTPLPAGKFPADLLGEYLNAFDFEDPSVLLRPRIGEDTAAVDVSGEEVLILKSDPITFATDAVGHYAVLVNANDIATSGAVPRWFLTTLLFPPRTTPAGAFQVMRDLEAVCRRWGITLCGGHTEITDAVTRPVVNGMLAGTVKRADLIDKAAMRPGDRVLLTKGIAVEGTSIIAREFRDQLLEKGVPAEEIDRCSDFLSRISVLDEARIAAKCPGTSAMHDVTEGGVASALEELSIAGGHRIRVFVENIPVFPQTMAMCRLFDIHPLGLIGSGSLLICCREENVKDLIGEIFRAGVAVTMIGEVREAGTGIEALQEGQPAAWPRFEVDEITRLF